MLLVRSGTSLEEVVVVCEGWKQLLDFEIARTASAKVAFFIDSPARKTLNARNHLYTSLYIRDVFLFFHDEKKKDQEIFFLSE
jgi:hypothetical protein